MPSDFRLYTPEEAFESGAVLVDVRRVAEYREGHVPGAVSLSFSNIITIKGLAFDIPPPQELSTLLSERGIEKDDIVVAYDDFYGKHAARFIYTLELYGHRKLGLLDRTYAQYLAEGGSGERGQGRARARSKYEASVDVDGILTAQGILELLRRPGHGLQLVDARAQEDFRLGHIPGALNLPWLEIIADHRILKPAQELRSIALRHGVDRARPIITYCEEGTSSALLTYALRLAGCAQVRNYYLSYGEWGSDPRLPKERSS